MCLEDPVESDGKEVLETKRKIFEVDFYLQSNNKQQTIIEVIIHLKITINENGQNAKCQQKA